MAEIPEHIQNLVAELTPRNDGYMQAEVRKLLKTIRDKSQTTKKVRKYIDEALGGSPCKDTPIVKEIPPCSQPTRFMTGHTEKGAEI